MSMVLEFFGTPAMLDMGSVSKCRTATWQGQLSARKRVAHGLQAVDSAEE